MNRGGFSWKRMLGISSAKSKISRKIGIPLTRAGRQRKIGAMTGCATIIVSEFVFGLVVIVKVIR